MPADAQQLMGLLGMFIGILFFYSGAAKLASLQIFTRTVSLITSLPERFARVVALMVITAEIVLSIGVILGRAWARAGVIAMLVVFSGVALRAHVRAQHVPCNCFGAGESDYLSLSTVGRNIVFGVLTALTLLYPAQRTPVLTEIYGLVLFLLFVTASKAAHNRRNVRIFMEARL